MVKRQVALITGASAGIGRAFAKVFARNDYDLIIVARSEDKLHNLAQELSGQFGTNSTVLPADLSQPQAAQALFAEVEARKLAVNVLVNNAGINSVKPFKEVNAAELETLVQLNIVALMSLTRLFLEPMLLRGNGRILNVASIAAYMPTPTFAAYGASKAFVLSFSEAIAAELADTGITVTAFCPGFTETAMLEQGGGIEDLIPPFMKLDAETVAWEGYRACMAGSPVQADSLRNNLLVQWIQAQPRAVVRGVGSFIARIMQDH